MLRRSDKPSQFNRCGVLPSAAAVAFALLAVASGRAQLPAFPGAQGAGAYAIGGRNGDVYHVTNLSDSGSGSLRFGITNAPAAGRTIVFDVSGMIALESTLRIRRPFVTIAGQTAPGLGICIKNFDTQIEFTHDVVLQHLRFRPGLDRGGTAAGQFNDDSLEMNDVTRVIVDHCSASWSVDECLSSAGTNTNITVQWCFITEGLHDTHVHPYGPTQKHSDGSLFTCQDLDGFLTAHHNLWAHQNLRSPRVRSYDFFIHTVDLRNNVVYNWGDAACYAGGDTSGLYDDYAQINFIGTYSIAGPSTLSNSLNYAVEDWGDGINPAIGKTWDLRLYLSGNKIDSNRNGLLDGTDTGWAMATGPYVPQVAPFAMPGAPVTTEPVDLACQRVLAEGGARAWSRDSVDTRIVSQVVTQTGNIINSQADVGGYPVIPEIARGAAWDADGDGMPDGWEVRNGMNPVIDDHMGDLDGDGYTNLEEYLAVAGRTAPADIDLDGDIDSQDLAEFLACMGGPEAPYTSSCPLPAGANGHLAVDFDNDGDLDQTDFGRVQACLSAPGYWADPDCAE